MVKKTTLFRFYPNFIQLQSRHDPDKLDKRTWTAPDCEDRHHDFQELEKLSSQFGLNIKWWFQWLHMPLPEIHRNHSHEQYHLYIKVQIFLESQKKWNNLPLFIVPASQCQKKWEIVSKFTWAVSSLLKFRYFELGTKIRNNLPVFSHYFRKVEDCFKVLWPSQNIFTLKKYKNMYVQKNQSRYVKKTNIPIRIQSKIRWSQLKCVFENKYQLENKMFISKSYRTW